MNYKQLLRDITPPIVWRGVRAIKGSNREENRTYASYSEALKYCGAGYEEKDLVKVVIGKNIRLKHELENGTPHVLESTALRTLVGIGIVGHRPELNVVDFGGGGGTHYLFAKAVLGERINLRWHVVETNAMVTEGSRIEDQRLKFFSDIDAAAASLGRVDLVFSSGALQYVPDPAHFLAKLLSVGAEHVFLTRIGLSEVSSRTIIQESQLSANGPGPLPADIQDRRICYPATFPLKHAFESLIRQRYDIKTIFVEERDAHKVGDERIHMYGYYAKLKS
jgi:putative methyltransferase (TIGR04325 family)